MRVFRLLGFHIQKGGGFYEPQAQVYLPFGSLVDPFGNDHSRIGYRGKAGGLCRRIPRTRLAAHRLSHLEEKEVNHMWGLAILPVALIVLMVCALWRVNHSGDDNYNHIRKEVVL